MLLTKVNYPALGLYRREEGPFFSGCAGFAAQAAELSKIVASPYVINYLTAVRPRVILFPHGEYLGFSGCWVV